MIMDPTLVITAACLVGICVVAFALLRAWQGWLDLKQRELDLPSFTCHVRILSISGTDHSQGPRNTSSLKGERNGQACSIGA